MNKKLWDYQYQQGMWEILKSSLEVKRFQMVAKLTKKYSNYGNILDLGCGEGILQKYLDPNCYNTYLGVDLSEEAIKRAKSTIISNVSYECHDMEMFIPTLRFDIIIFNESIYYSPNPINIFKRYRKFLNLKGRIILSIFEDIRNNQIMSEINTQFTPEEHTYTKNQRGIWHCLVY